MIAAISRLIEIEDPPGEIARAELRHAVIALRSHASEKSNESLSGHDEFLERTMVYYDFF